MKKESVKKKEDLAVNYKTNKVPIVSESYTISETYNFVKKNIDNFETIDYIYAIDSKENLVGIISIKRIFKHPGKTKLKDIIKRNFVSVSPETPQIKVANLAIKHKIKAVPVIKDKKLEGVIIATGVYSMLNRDLHKHLLYFAGVHKGQLEYENTLQVPLLVSIKHRIPWLIIGLIGITLAAVFISKFEKILESHIILAFFIPAIVYMSDALGTQLQTLFIRDLAVLGKELKLSKYFARQILIGFIMAFLIAIITYIITLVIWKQPYIALVISVTMFITLITSSFNSMLITYLFKVFKQDPALGSGPFATIFSDVISIVIYLVVVSLML